MKVVKGDFFMKIFLGVFYFLFVTIPAHGSNNDPDFSSQKSPAERLAAFQAKQAERRMWQKADIDAGKKSFEAQNALRAAGKTEQVKEN